ncbi:Zn(II)2Cys6 transcription factor KNAG_0J02130 [Huiozyma naganishii CBS 8797]|uniref:Zn(2)-C6 fungal-type domain-containing protein n=1 Tax=Huiozyma naganishii (strain ATCC MYA-139 / BCRC 22969 / CBS 8797 / KCTC 17520 / NBRC 10181 / NCYC 3082 / Yp74L-3) TaxID=1071383 RepID=J7S9T8_HUIN7|nr:hypothetical protein KNAG_0J02130 [Kazachstania naganishii CBS 8797]CCK72294.1 hypothetical protein KNAG_0J02130 [Kazachstania naganishii CBS 8797]
MKRAKFGPKTLTACQYCYTKKIKCNRNNFSEACTKCIALNIECKNRTPINMILIREESSNSVITSLKPTNTVSEANEEYPDGGTTAPVKVSKSAALLSSSIHFYNIIYRNLQKLFEKIHTETDVNIPEHASEFFEFNINELVVDFSFLKRNNKSRMSSTLELNELPPIQVSKRWIHAVCDVLALSYQFLMIGSILKITDWIYKQGERGPIDLDDPHIRTDVIHVLLLLSVGQLYLRDTTEHFEEYPGLKYFKKAVSLLEDNFDNPDISYLEILILIIIYLISLNRLRYSYLYIGNALRCAYLLGLHKDSTYDNSAYTVEERERMCRVWWTIYNLEKFISSKVGCPSSIANDIVEKIRYPIDGNYDHAMRMSFFLIERINFTKIKNKITDIMAGGDINKLLVGNGCVFDLMYTSSQELITQWNTIIGMPGNRYMQRSFFSLVLRMNECILLVTSIFFLKNRRRMLYGLLGKEDPFPEGHNFAHLSVICIQAATSNLRILQALRKKELLLPYGYNDMDFLFYGVIIVLLGLKMKAPLYERFPLEDAYSNAMDLLNQFTNVGNVIANDYRNRLVALQKELERLDVLIVSKTGDNPPVNTFLNPVEEGPFNRVEMRFEEYFQFTSSICSSLESV